MIKSIVLTVVLWLVMIITFAFGTFFIGIVKAIYKAVSEPPAEEGRIARFCGMIWEVVCRIAAWPKKWWALWVFAFITVALTENWRFFLANWYIVIPTIIAVNLALTLFLKVPLSYFKEEWKDGEHSMVLSHILFFWALILLAFLPESPEEEMAL